MTTNIQIDQVTALIRVGELAMQLHRANEEVREARAYYYASVKEFEARFNGGERIKVDENNPLYVQRRLDTSLDFFEYEDAKKKAYRAKRKLFAACEKMGKPVSRGTQ